MMWVLGGLWLWATVATAVAATGSLRARRRRGAHRLGPVMRRVRRSRARLARREWTDASVRVARQTAPANLILCCGVTRHRPGW